MHSNVHPETIADDIIKKTQIAPPFNFDYFLEYYTELRIIKDTIKGTGYLVELGPHKFDIIVDRKSSKERQRFTIAHELAHWVLMKLQKKWEDMPLEKITTPYDVERWCDKFASNLLMPKEWMNKLIQANEEVGHPNIVFFGPQKFQVSKTSFYLRLNELYGAIIVERIAKKNEYELLFYPKRYASKESKDIINKLGEKTLGKEKWYSSKGGISSGPHYCTVDKKRRKIVFVLRGLADTSNAVTSKLTKFID